MDVCSPAEAGCTHVHPFGSTGCTTGLDDTLSLLREAALHSQAVDVDERASGPPTDETAVDMMNVFADLIKICRESHSQKKNAVNPAVVDAEVLKDLQVVAKVWTSLADRGKENGAHRAKGQMLDNAEKKRKHKLNRGASAPCCHAPCHAPGACACA